MIMMFKVGYRKIVLNKNEVLVLVRDTWIGWNCVLTALKISLALTPLLKKL